MLVCVVLSCLFLVALWSPAGKGPTSLLSCLLCHFPKCVLVHIRIKGEVGAVKPSSKIFYRQFQGGTSFVDLLCFFLSCVCYAFVIVCLYMPRGHLLGKG